MSARKGLYLSFWLDGYKLTSNASNVEVGAECDQIDAGAYGNAVKGYLAGRAESRIEFEGFFDDAVTATHPALKTPGGATNKLAGVAYGNNATPTTGDIACAMPVHQSNYQVSSEIDGVVAVKASLKCVGTALEWGTLLANLTGVSADGDTASVDNAASSADGGVGYLFLTGVSAGDTIEVKIQDSANNSTWADLITFTLNGSAIGAERVEVAGTVDRYLQVVYDVTGSAVSFDLAVIFKRN